MWQGLGRDAPAQNKMSIQTQNVPMGRGLRVWAPMLGLLGCFTKLISLEHPAPARPGEDFVPHGAAGRGVTVPSGLSRSSPRRREKPRASTESVRSVTAVWSRAGAAQPKPHDCLSHELPC